MLLAQQASDTLTQRGALFLHSSVCLSEPTWSARSASPASAPAPLAPSARCALASCVACSLLRRGSRNEMPPAPRAERRAALRRSAARAATALAATRHARCASPAQASSRTSRRDPPDFARTFLGVRRQRQDSLVLLVRGRQVQVRGRLPVRQLQDLRRGAVRALIRSDRACRSRSAISFVATSFYLRDEPASVVRDIMTT